MESLTYHMEYETPVVNNDVPVTTERDYINTRQIQSLDTLNDPLYNNPFKNMEYETLDDNVQRDYVNTKPKETQEVNQYIC